MLAVVPAATAMAQAVTPAQEQGVEDTLTLLQAEQKTVTADLRPETPDVAPAEVTVYDHRQISAMGARTLLDVLRTSTGIDIGRTPLGDDQVIFRGATNPAELLVLIDGMRINSVYDGYAPMDLPVALIDRVEILRGPGSALYGTDAFAGVVQVFTRHPEGVTAFVDTEDSGGGALRLDGFRYQLGAGNHTGKFYYGASISQSTRTGAVESIGNDVLNPPASSGVAPLLSPLTGSSQSAAPGDLSDWRNQLVGDARVSGQDLLTEGDVLALTGRLYSESHGEYFGPLGTLAPDGSLSRAQDQAQLSYEVPLSAVFSLTTRLYLDRERIDDLLDLSPAGYVAVPPGLSSGFFPEGQQTSLTLTTWTYGGEGRLTARLPFHNTATAGVQVEDQSVTAYSAASNFSPGGAYLGGLVEDANAGRLASGVSRTIIGAYVQDIFEPWTPLAITAGLRLDDYSDFGTSWNPRVSVVYRPWRYLWVKALYANAFSAPTFQELYDNSNADLNGYVSNPSLGPERIWTGEGEVGVTLPVGASGGFDASVNAFHNDVTGSIEEIPLFGNDTPLANAADLSQWGLEGQIRLRFKWLSVFGNASDMIDDQVTFSYSEAALQIQATSSEITDVPRVLANLGASVGPFFGLTLTALGHFASERENDWRTALERLHAWTIPAEADLDVVLATATFWSFFRAFVAVYNVTDTPMYDPTPYATYVPNLPRSPRSFACAIRMDY
ncbi:MAG TPA: TonB-dependent receptor [Myxococcales bacterium]|nr:TonB-dependent receptor [Myxococcales bacterium]